MGEGLRRRHLTCVVCAALAVVSMAVGWVTLLTLLELHPDSWATPALEFGGLALNVTTLLLVVVLAPLTEEILFRGLIFRRLLRYARPTSAALYSSVLFGLMHLDPLGATVFGLVMVVLYTRSASLWVPVAAHMLNNLIGFSLAWAEAVYGDFPVHWATVALLPLSLPWLIWFLRPGLRHLQHLQDSPGQTGHRPARPRIT